MIYMIYDIWYDTVRYDTIWYMIWYIYLLSAIEFSPGGSSTVHIYTQQYTEKQNEAEHTGRNIHNNKNS